MAYPELIQQLEFFRDIGIDALNLTTPKATHGEIPMADTITATEVPLSTSAEGSSENLDAIRADLGECQRCKLAPTRSTIVYGSGNPKAEIVFVGEAPGYEEDQQGLPFVGEAGRLLTKIIESIAITGSHAHR